MTQRLAPPGASGLKSKVGRVGQRPTSLAPPGASGLKYEVLERPQHLPGSRPTRGEWIEIALR